MMETLWKYDVSVMKVVRMTRVNSIIIVVTVSEGKKQEALLPYQLLYHTFLHSELFSAANMNTPVTPVCCHIFSTNE
jgi:hypothetical protein